VVRYGLIALLLCAGCEPEIGNGTYFCGPERLCPPDQSCDDNSFTCVGSNSAERFSCSDDANVAEPDDVPSQAFAVGALACGVPPLDLGLGCVESVNDEDFVTFDLNLDCPGSDPRIEMTLSYPIALVPLTLELLDENERLVAEGELCTRPANFSGMDSVCIEMLPPMGQYFVRVGSESDAPDCDGDCHFNQYTLSIDFPLN
jgi:hypothetical protein